MIKQTKKFDTPESFLEYLNSKFNYGFIVNGKVEQENFNKYKTVSPEEFERIKTGVCWDFAEYEAKVFKEIFKYDFTIGKLVNGKFSLYYIQMDDNENCPTHTWLAYKTNNKVFVLESAWTSNRGIHEYSSEWDMINKYRDRWLEDYSIKYPLAIWKYKPFKKFNLTCTQYMDIIYDTGRVIYSTHPKIKAEKEI